MDRRLIAVCATAILVFAQVVPALVMASATTSSLFGLPVVASGTSTQTISSSGVGPTAISLNWTESYDPTFFYYVLQEFTDNSQGWQTVAQISDRTVTSYYDYGLTPGASLSWQVYYYYIGKSSVLSNQLNETQPANASLTFSMPTSTLAWDNNAVYGGLLSFSSYKLMELTNSGPYTMIANITDPSVLNYTLDPLVASHSYRFYLNTTDVCNSCTNPVVYNPLGPLPSSSISNTVIIPGPGPQLAITTHSQRLIAGACSTVIIVQSQDRFGAPSNVTSGTTVDLSTSSTSGAFYSDSACTRAITSATIADNTNSTSFFYEDTEIDSPMITVSAYGLASATQSETVSPTAPSKLVDTTSPQALVAGACSTAMIVQTQDSFNNPSDITDATTVSLATTSFAGAFYSDSGCLARITSAVIAGGTNNISFFYNDTFAGSPTITASATGLSSATQTEIVKAATLAQLAFATPAQIVSPDTCSSTITIQSQDVFGNPANLTYDVTVTLSTTSSTGTFYSEPTCTTATTSVAMTAGSNNTSFFYKDNSTESLMITASATGLTRASQEESVLSALATAVPNAIDVGQQTSLSCKGSGGTPPYTYSWSFGEGRNSEGANVTHTYQRAGTMFAICTVTDSSNPHAIATTGVPIIVSPDPSIASFAASPANLVLGGRVDFNVSATGGEGELSYSYTGLPAGCHSANTSLLSCTPTAAGNYNVTVTITDHAGKSATATVRLSINKQPSPLLSNLMLTFVAIGAAIATLAAAGAVLLLRRKQ